MEWLAYLHKDAKTALLPRVSFPDFPEASPQVQLLKKRATMAVEATACADICSLRKMESRCRQYLLLDDLARRPCA